ncbi:MAG: YggS family pyridoxal phosphate-dependent enzyme [Candidatus Rariloculaceae bacterium]
MTQITDHIAEIRERVRNAQLSGDFRDTDVTILAVSKRQRVSAIRAAYDAGVRDFGENVVQEATGKLEELQSLDITWHFIGRIQSNKTRDIARNFHWAHAVDRLKVATRLNDQRPHYCAPLNVCLQVNLAGEEQKSGVDESQLEALAHKVMSLPRLQLRGLMTLPPAAKNPEDNSQFFARLRGLKDSLSAAGIHMDTLSMGMSADFEVAIRQGSTIVRVGTAIFGIRPQSDATSIAP